MWRWVFVHPDAALITRCAGAAVRLACVRLYSTFWMAFFVLFLQLTQFVYIHPLTFIQYSHRPLLKRPVSASAGYYRRHLFSCLTYFLHLSSFIDLFFKSTLIWFISKVPGECRSLLFYNAVTMNHICHNTIDWRLCHMPSLSMFPVARNGNYTAYLSRKSQ